jgi:hypothetical protein
MYAERTRLDSRARAPQAAGRARRRYRRYDGIHELHALQPRLRRLVLKTALHQLPLEARLCSCM